MSLLAKIKERGYWEVTIRPTTFVEQRVAKLTELEKIALAAQVRIRGWPFPVDERGRLSLRDNYVAGEVEWGDHWETWRLFQSGLFVWFKANRWDLMAEQGSGGGRRETPGKTLSVGDTIYLFREFLEFASRLALSRAGDDRMRIEVTSHGLSGRHLWVDPWHDTPGRICETPEWSFARDYSRQQLAAEAREIGLEAAIDLFQRFAWDVSASVLESILAK